MGRQGIIKRGAAMFAGLTALTYLAGCSHQSKPVAKVKSPPAAEIIATPAQVPAADDIAVRIYDVRDILVVQPPGLPSTISRTTNNLAWNGEQQRAQLIQDLITTIEFTVDPGSWNTNPGEKGSLRELHGQLIVSQTAANQERVSRLLEQIRFKRDLQITLNCRAILVGEEGLKLLDTFEAVKTTANVAAFLTPEQVSQLLGARGRSPVISLPQITLSNGGNGSYSVSQGYSYISGYRPKTAGDVNGTYIVETRAVQTGVSFYMEAAISSDRRYVITKMRPKVSHLNGMKTAPAPGVPAEKKLLIQVPQVTELGIGTEPAGFKGDAAVVALPEGHSALFAPDGGVMVSIPDGGTLAIGGVKVTDDFAFNSVVTVGETQAKGNGATNTVSSARYLIFLVQPTIVQPKE